MNCSCEPTCDKLLLGKPPTNWCYNAQQVTYLLLVAVLMDWAPSYGAAIDIENQHQGRVEPTPGTNKPSLYIQTGCSLTIDNDDQMEGGWGFNQISSHF